MRTHGPWCRKRSFPLACKACGKTLLYWECTHGSRVLLEFDAKGRLAGSHKCKGDLSKQTHRKKRVPFDYDGDFGFTSVTKTFLEKLFQESCRCPACGVEFTTADQCEQHVKAKKEFDEAHASLFNERQGVPPSTSGESRGGGPGASTAVNEFGRIRIKRKGEKATPVHSSRDWWDEFGGEDGDRDTEKDGTGE